ncbi:YncE family protein [Kitasatospora sp. NPDC056531]|uniref:YncE family protein n=1 Tax=Kitasatospora sp. NPDC056531 TaxID=3345856 RepID=UPI0036B68FDE
MIISDFRSAVGPLSGPGLVVVDVNDGTGTSCSPKVYPGVADRNRSGWSSWWARDRLLRTSGRRRDRRTNRSEGSVTPSIPVLSTVSVGLGPTGVAIAPDGGRLYVANSGSGTVSVVDVASGSTAATITVERDPQGLAITPDGRRAYVTHAGLGLVSVIDTDSNVVTGTIAVSEFPSEVAITPDGRRAYVARALADQLTIIDTATDSVTGSSDRLETGALVGVAISPDGRRAYVLPEGTCLALVLDTATNTQVPGPPILIGCAAADVAFTPDGRHALSTSSSLGEQAELYVVDTATQKAHNPVLIGDSAYGITGVSS